MRYLFVILLCAVLFPQWATGQCVPLQERPTWADGFFRDLRNSYLEVTTGAGATEQEARDNAAQELLRRRGFATGQRVQVINGAFVAVDGSQLEVRARVIDEFRERCENNYRVSLLVQTAKNPMLAFESVEFSTRYPFSARVFVPGMAQFHKGSRGKGVMFIGAQTVTVGGIIVAESLRATNASKINTTHDLARRKHYIDNANMFETVRNVAIAGAAAVYLWNVIDGIVAGGVRHVRITNHAHLNITPMASPNTGGVVLALNF